MLSFKKNDLLPVIHLYFNPRSIGYLIFLLDFVFCINCSNQYIYVTLSFSLQNYLEDEALSCDLNYERFRDNPHSV